MVRRGARAFQDGQGADRFAVLLIWLFGLAPIVFPAAVAASATVFKRAAPAVVTMQAVLQKPDVDGRAVMARPSSEAAKIELRVTKPAQLDRPIAPAMLGAPRPWLQIPGAVAIRTSGFESARLAPVRIASSAAPMGWVMKRFGSVKVLDGLRIASGSLVLALAGVEPPLAAATCRRLDGVLESCLTRATSRLAVLVEGRPVSCEVFRAVGPDGESGRCKAGNIDLAADLVRNGLASRS